MYGLFKTLPVSQNMQRRIIRWLVIMELVGTWKKAIVTNMRYSHGINGGTVGAQEVAQPQ
jgi:hypothetical protein